VRLDLPLLFTTNYDELIEAAYQEGGRSLRVSVSEEQFLARRAEKPSRHLVKLHGSIDQPDSIVLTRNDYARARIERKEMLSHLRGEMAATSFLFVGFSLSDPNFGLLHDDIRMVYGHEPARLLHRPGTPRSGQGQVPDVHGRKHDLARRLEPATRLPDTPEPDLR
jgi:hypothetical protein